MSETGLGEASSMDNRWPCLPWESQADIFKWLNGDVTPKIAWAAACQGQRRRAAGSRQHGVPEPPTLVSRGWSMYRERSVRELTVILVGATAFVLKAATRALDADRIGDRQKLTNATGKLFRSSATGLTLQLAAKC